MTPIHEHEQRMKIYKELIGIISEMRLAMREELGIFYV